MEIRHRLGLCLLLLIPALSTQAGTTLYYPQVLHQDARNDYYLAVLKLALEKTADEGDITPQPHPERLSQNRAVRMLSGDEPKLSVMWSMTTPEREIFADIKNKRQLAKFTAGQGEGWPDADILLANDLDVATPANYRSLFDMLALKRIDYIPRGVNEPWRELENYPEQNFAVDSTLLLYYPSAHYFFVHRDDRALAERLERGLERALADGSFDQLFYSHPINAQAFERAGLVKRRLLRFDNPLLPEATPTERDELWWLPPQMRVANKTTARP